MAGTSLRSRSRRGQVFFLQQSEKEYLNGLNRIARVYRDPLAQGVVPYLTPDEISVLFSRVDALIACHQQVRGHAHVPSIFEIIRTPPPRPPATKFSRDIVQLYNSLENLSKKWPVIEGCGSVFLDFVRSFFLLPLPFSLLPLSPPAACLHTGDALTCCADRRAQVPRLSCYAPYFANVLQAKKTLVHAMHRNEGFRAWLNQQDGSQQTDSLQHLLFQQPLVRLKTYEEVMLQLLKNTGVMSADYRALEVCVQVTKRLVHWATSTVQETAVNEDLLMAQKLLGAQIDLLSSKKRLIRRGPVHLGHKKRFVFLFNDVCLITKAVNNNDHVIEYTLPVKDLQVELLKNRQSIEIRCGSTLIVIATKTVDESLSWILTFKEALDNLKQVCPSCIHIYISLFLLIDPQGVFGVPLESLERSPSGLPRVIESIAKYLSTNGTVVPAHAPHRSAETATRLIADRSTARGWPVDSARGGFGSESAEDADQQGGVKSGRHRTRAAAPAGRRPSRPAARTARTAYASRGTPPLAAISRSILCRTGR